MAELPLPETIKKEDLELVDVRQIGLSAGATTYVFLTDVWDKTYKGKRVAIFRLRGRNDIAVLLLLE